MPLGIRPYPRSHKLALPLYTYPQPKARGSPGNQANWHLQRLRDVPHKRRNELPMLRSLSIAPTALYKSRPKPLAQTKQLAPCIASRRGRCLRGLRAPARHLHESLQTC